jgi:hypothetical protein
MHYAPDAIRDLITEHRAVLESLQNLMRECLVQGLSVNEPRVHHHLIYGAGRRLDVLQRSLQNIFEIFPPPTDTRLTMRSLTDVQINLHAFVINLSGIFDNWAWAFVIRHNLESRIGDYRSVSLFKGATKKYLPPEIRSYISSSGMTSWYKDYLKNYRDGLAHRIPLYIPPGEFTSEETKRYDELEHEAAESIRSRELERLDRILEEQAVIGKPSLFFLDFVSDASENQPRVLHQQLIMDVKGVIEFGELYFRHWHQKSG